MLPDRVSNPGPLTYESGALPIALRGLALTVDVKQHSDIKYSWKICPWGDRVVRWCLVNFQYQGVLLI